MRPTNERNWMGRRPSSTSLPCQPFHVLNRPLVLGEPRNHFAKIQQVLCPLRLHVRVLALVRRYTLQELL